MASSTTRPSTSSRPTLARGATLTLGNHDQLYLDLASGDRAYADRLPAWLRESAEQTFAAIDPARLRALPWTAEVAIGPVFIAHANPFAYGDWTYLEGADPLCPRRGRADRARRRASACSATPTAPASSGTGATICNTGSIGQPRNRERASTFLVLEISDARDVSAAIEPISYDVDAHVRNLRASGLTAPTVARLCAFFVG